MAIIFTRQIRIKALKVVEQTVVRMETRNFQITAVRTLARPVNGVFFVLRHPGASSSVKQEVLLAED